MGADVGTLIWIWFTTLATCLVLVRLALVIAQTLWFTALDYDEKEIK